MLLGSLGKLTGIQRQNISFISILAIVPYCYSRRNEELEMFEGLRTRCIGACMMAGKSEWLRRPRTGNGDAVLDHAGMVMGFLE